MLNFCICEMEEIRVPNASAEEETVGKVPAHTDTEGAFLAPTALSFCLGEEGQRFLHSRE